MEDIQNLIPADKSDVRKAAELVARGYPAVEPVLPEILEWIKDFNWPVAKIFTPFLATIGAPLAPHVRAILGSNDDVWKYWVLLCVVSKSPGLAKSLQAELERLATAPSKGEREEEVDDGAKNILRELK